jgi:arachidonate 15-lipoxygenase
MNMIITVFGICAGVGNLRGADTLSNPAAANITSRQLLFSPPVVDDSIQWTDTNTALPGLMILKSSGVPSLASKYVQTGWVLAVASQGLVPQFATQHYAALDKPIEPGPLKTLNYIRTESAKMNAQGVGFFEIKRTPLITSIVKFMGSTYPNQGQEREGQCAKLSTMGAELFKADSFASSIKTTEQCMKSNIAAGTANLQEMHTFPGTETLTMAGFNSAFVKNVNEADILPMKQSMVSSDTDKLPTVWFEKDTMYEYLPLTGSNPRFLRAATETDLESIQIGHPSNPSSMTVEQTLETIGPLSKSALGGLFGMSKAAPKTLKEAVVMKRLMILDYSDFIDVPLSPITENKPDQQYLFPARGLFVVNADGDLRAVAIQCGDQTKLDSRTATPWYTPPSPEKRTWTSASGEAKSAMTEWAMAKSCVMSADISYFQLVTHLGHTHLVAEAFAVSTPRTLPKKHNIRKLLDAHLDGTLLINGLATQTLIAPGDIVDVGFPPPIEVSTGVAVKAAKNYRAHFTDHSFPNSVAKQNWPKDLKSPFLEDAQLYWDAIQPWVESYVQTEYPSDATVVSDSALQNWVGDLKSNGNVGRFCTVGGQVQDDIQTRDCLTEVLSHLIWQASVGHAVTNFPQKFIGQYVPIQFAGPLMNGPSDPALTKADKESGMAFMKMMPKPKPALKQRDFGGLLGSVHHTVLGRYTTALSSKFGAAKKQFKAAIANIGTTVVQRNTPCAKQGVVSRLTCKETRRNSFQAYNILLPDKVPQSINI